MIDAKATVLTPTGGKPLDEIKPGDAVLSVAGSKLLVNKVFNTRQSQSGGLVRISCGKKSVVCEAPHGLAQKIGQRRFAQSGRPAEQDMLQRLITLQGCFYQKLKPFDRPRLPTELLEQRRS